MSAPKSTAVAKSSAGRLKTRAKPGAKDKDGGKGSDEKVESGDSEDDISLFRDIGRSNWSRPIRFLSDIVQKVMWGRRTFGLARTQRDAKRAQVQGRAVSNPLSNEF